MLKMISDKIKIQLLSVMRLRDVSRFPNGVLHTKNINIAP